MRKVTPGIVTYCNIFRLFVVNIILPRNGLQKQKEISGLLWEMPVADGMSLHLFRSRRELAALHGWLH